MKKIYYLFCTLLLAAVPLFLFTSCGDDDDNDEPSSSSSSIVGCWSDISDYPNEPDYFQFKKDGTCTWFTWVIDYEESRDVTTSTYKIDGSSFVFTSNFVSTESSYP